MIVLLLPTHPETPHPTRLSGEEESGGLGIWYKNPRDKEVCYEK